MKDRHNSKSDSLFSFNHKISYTSKDRIQPHQQKSKLETNFIKAKLAEAYQKLQSQIQVNFDLQQQNESLIMRLKQLQQKYLYQKKENSKLKETLEVIIQNRKMVQEEKQELKRVSSKRLQQKEKLFDELHQQNKILAQKCKSLSAEIQQKERLIEDHYHRLRQESIEKDIDIERQIALTNKIQILEQQIVRITEEKYVEVNRLRHELQLYQRSASPFVKQIKIDEKFVEKSRQFCLPSINQNSSIQRYSSKATDQQYFSNKQNHYSSQINPNSSFKGGKSISNRKKRNQSKETIKNNQITSQQIATMGEAVSDDQQLIIYQTMRKKAQLQLCALQKIKRANNVQRQKITRLQRQIYHLDSDIAGLKRRIRRKY